MGAMRVVQTSASSSVGLIDLAMRREIENFFVTLVVNPLLDIAAGAELRKPHTLCHPTFATAVTLSTAHHETSASRNILEMHEIIGHCHET